MSERFKIRYVNPTQIILSDRGQGIVIFDESQERWAIKVVKLLNTYEDQLAEMSGTIDGLEVEVKRLNDKYTIDHCDCENLRLEMQRLENENERLEEELRLALN